MGDEIKRKLLDTWFRDQGLETVGEFTGKITNAASLQKANANSISFCSKEDSLELGEGVENTLAPIIICHSNPYSNSGFLGKMLVPSPNPRLTFMRLVNSFFVPTPSCEIDPSAIIHPEARLGVNVSIGANCVIGNAEIGDESQLDSNVTIKDKVLIGKNVSIFSGTVIGADGFGYERNSEGKIEKFPHIGGVVIEDNVEIGSNTSIDRGTLDDTIIRSGAKIDNQIHVAHNVDVGHDSIVIAQTMLGGGVVIGDRSWIAPGAVIANKITIGSDATVGLGAVVVKNVADGQTVLGAPARPQDEFRKVMNFMRSGIQKLDKKES